MEWLTQSQSEPSARDHGLTPRPAQYQARVPCISDAGKAADTPGPWKVPDRLFPWLSASMQRRQLLNFHLHPRLAP